MKNIKQCGGTWKEGFKSVGYIKLTENLIGISKKLKTTSK